MGIGRRLLHYSGGGGGDDYVPMPPRRPGDTGGGDPCEIEIEVVLQATNLALLKNLPIGHVLSVEVVIENGKERLCAKDNGEIVGAIVSPLSPQIVACIKQGNRYRATISEINGNAYRVRIKRV